jgi:pimeloyl-ACP methyl ester carboxylesterase
MASPDVSTAHVDGQSLAYRHAGNGSPLVLLHGFTLDSRIWRRQLQQLSDGFTVIAWDAPGAGASSDPPDPFTMTDWARCLASFLDGMGIVRAHILGMSWGGVLAQEFYRLCPTRTRSLILAGTYAGWRGSLPPTVCSERLAACTRGASLPAQEFVRQWVPGLISGVASQNVRDELSSIVSDLHPVGFRIMATSLHDTDTTDLLPQIHVPTLLVWGDDDRRSPLSIAAQLRAAIPSCELIVIPNAGHVCNMEQPDAFNAHVRRFCLATPLSDI